MMKKHRVFKIFILVLVTLFSSNVLSISNVLASEYIDFIAFTQLEKTDQRRLIESTQRLVANYEEVQIQAYKRKRKYSNIQDFLNFLINDSYAQNNVAGNKRLCIYGGWFGYVYGEKEKCPHPLQYNTSKNNDGSYKSSSFQELVNADVTKDKIQGEIIKSTQVDYKELIKNYKMNEVCSSNGKGQGTSAMICNPKIFGTKEGGEPFCAYGNQNTYNTSYDCLGEVDIYVKKKAKDEKKNEVDVKNAILDRIIEKGITNNDPSAIDSLSNMLIINYDICMCKGRGNYINTSYATRMYKQRTCFAWLYQTKEILGRMKSNRCSAVGKIPLNQTLLSSNTNLKDMDAWAISAYDKIQESLKDSPKNRSEWFAKGADKDDPAWPDRPNIEGSCPISVDKAITAEAIPAKEKAGYMLVTGSLIGLNAGKEPQTGWAFSAPKGNEFVEYGTKKDNKIYYKQTNKEYIVTVKLKGVDTPATVSIDPISVQQKCLISIDGEDGRHYTKTNVAKKVKKGEDPNKNPKEKPIDLVVKIGNPQSPAEPNFSGELKLVVTVPKAKDLDLDKFNITWGPETVKADKTKAIYSKPEAVTITASFGKTTKYSCELNVPLIEKIKDKDVIDDSENYKIKLSQKDEKENIVKVTAVVTKNGKVVKDLDKESLKIDWSKSIIKRKIASKDKVNDDGVTPVKEGSDPVIIVKDSTDLTQKISKLSDKQKVYATLMKNKEEKSKADQTIGIKKEKIKEKTVPNSLGNNNPAFKKPTPKSFIQKRPARSYGGKSPGNW